MSIISKFLRLSDSKGLKKSILQTSMFQTSIQFTPQFILSNEHDKYVTNNTVLI